MNEENVKKGLIHIQNIPEFALEVMKQVISIHNNFIVNKSDAAFFEMGVLIESLAQVIREEKK